MTVSDIIQLIGVLVSLGIGVASILISVFTLRQNSQMIRESTRPYIAISFEIVAIGSPKGFFIIKNYGNTGARITKFIYDSKIKRVKQIMDSLSDGFDLVVGTFLAPGQQKLIAFIPRSECEKEYTFDIEYTTGKETYRESFNLNVENAIETPSLHDSSKDRELRSISNALEEMVERRL